MRLYRLNVSRASAGVAIPFDRLYLGHGDVRKAVKKLFDYAIVMPLAEGLREQLRTEAPDIIAEHGALGVSTVRPRRMDEHTAWHQLLDSANDWVIVSPILPRIAAQMLPTYLTNNKWYWVHNRPEYTSNKRTARPRKKQAPIPNMAYLQTPTENFRPVCIACPRFNEHIAGNCMLGDPVCLKSLVLENTVSLPIHAPTDVREVGDLDGYAD